MERIVRTYKIAKKPYEKALKRGKGNLATLVEHWVCLYGQGKEMPADKFIDSLPKKVLKKRTS